MNTQEYCIPYAAAESEFVEKRSRFIGQVYPIATEEEARAYIESAKKTYYDARHNCWCYLLREGNIVRYSDDGEPQGTAGQPMLNVFQREGITNVCCIVTRYFGGILLGTGGLTRAYTKGAKDAMTEAGICRMGLWTQWQVNGSYPLWERVKLELEAAGGILEDVSYGAEIVLSYAMPYGTEGKLHQRWTELSAGRLCPRKQRDIFRGGTRESIR